MQVNLLATIGTQLRPPPYAIATHLFVLLFAFCLQLGRLDINRSDSPYWLRISLINKEKGQAPSL